MKKLVYPFAAISLFVSSLSSVVSMDQNTPKGQIVWCPSALTLQDITVDRLLPMLQDKSFSHLQDKKVLDLEGQLNLTFLDYLTFCKNVQEKRGGSLLSWLGYGSWRIGGPGIKLAAEAIRLSLKFPLKYDNIAGFAKAMNHVSSFSLPLTRQTNGNMPSGLLKYAIEKQKLSTIDTFNSIARELNEPTLKKCLVIMHPDFKKIGLPLEVIKIIQSFLFELRIPSAILMKDPTDKTNPLFLL